MSKQIHRSPAQNVPSYAEQLIASYTNCRDALNTFQAQGDSKEVRAIGGTSEFNSEVSIGRFIGQVHILVSMLTKSSLTPAYEAMVKAIDVPDDDVPEATYEKEWFKWALAMFHAVTELFEENHL